MARKVRQIRQKGKHVGMVRVPQTAAPDVEAWAASIQALIPVVPTRNTVLLVAIELRVLS